MTSRKFEKDAPLIGRDAEDRAVARRARVRQEIREKLESGELVIEFELEEPEATRH